MSSELLNQLKCHNVITKNGINPKHKVMLHRRPALLADLMAATTFVCHSKPYHLRERVACILLGITQIPICSQCDTPVKFIHRGVRKRNQYNIYCSRHCSLTSPETKAKRISTWIENYGVSNPSSAQVIKDKKKATSLVRYGCDYPWQQGIRLDLLNDSNWLLKQHITERKTLTEISDMVNCDVSVVSTYIHQHGIEVQHYTQSTGELEINQFIKSLGFTTKQGCRSLVPNREIDIFVPSVNLAIEFNGLYWHSERLGKDKWYHHNKWQVCKDQGIQLITIFDDEWREHRTQVENKLRSLLGVDTGRVVYARKCVVVEVSTAVKRKFFMDNHIQGNGPGTIHLGLEFAGELVAVMSLIKKQEIFTLNRYATKYRVIGGFSKILKFFRQNYEYQEIISFADLRWSDGNLYSATGWSLDKVLPPDYFYSLNGLHRYHKFNFRRSKLPNLLKSFNPTLSERVNCDNNGVLRIWDCGKLRFKITSS